ncbi:hypothetical protein [Peribacillus alkalitolerans]|uniref:hypothetical protein n=1 Tax=Peribacillus alkalitolerans TaxID=1550385 RepID=UPI0013D2AD15|nr:hypothetical protein [Peribacillus alkalitolerans]
MDLKVHSNAGFDSFFMSLPKNTSKIKHHHVFSCAMVEIFNSMNVFVKTILLIAVPGTRFQRAVKEPP